MVGATVRTFSKTDSTGPPLSHGKLLLQQSVAPHGRTSHRHGPYQEIPATVGLPKIGSDKSSLFNGHDDGRAPSVSLPL